MNSLCSREKEVIEKVLQTLGLANRLKTVICELVLRRASQPGSGVTKELQERCQRMLAECQEKSFSCRFCGKEFADGRQLGGHVSRAHYGQKFDEDSSDDEFPKKKKKPAIRRPRRISRKLHRTKQRETNSDVYLSDHDK